MHKNRLQELCHKRMWALPAYTNTRDGPDHIPLFGAYVVVNGQTFNTSNFYKSVKEAHNKAAEIALEHFSAIPSEHPTGHAPLPTTKAQISYKAQLQQYAQKRNIGVLKFDSVHEGFDHALRFKARVTIEGQTFESSQYFSTIKEAEHSAARVALMSLPLEENHQDEQNFYKNLLQQLHQKEGLPLPIYNTLCDRESRVPIFTSTLVLDGESFVGDAARTKKQAEMNVAKKAWNHVNGRIDTHSMKVSCGETIDNPKILTGQASSLKTEEMNQTAEGNDVCPAKVIQLQPATGLSLKYDDSLFSSRNRLVGINVMSQPYLNSIPASTLMIKEDHQAKGDAKLLEQQNGLSVSISNVKIKEEKQDNGKFEVHERVVTNKTYHEVLTNASTIMNEHDDGVLSFEYTDKLDLSNLKLDSNGSAAINRSAVMNNSHNSQNVNTHHNDIFSSGFVDQPNFSILKLDSDDKTMQEESKEVYSKDITTKAITDINADINKIVNSPSLLCNRVLVYPRKPNMVLPAGATIMPFSDGAWVAVSIDFSENEDKLPNVL